MPSTDGEQTLDAGATAPPQSGWHRFQRRMAPFAGPLLIAVCVAFATRGYLFTGRLTN